MHFKFNKTHSSKIRFLADGACLSVRFQIVRWTSRLGGVLVSGNNNKIGKMLMHKTLLSGLLNIWGQLFSDLLWEMCRAKKASIEFLTKAASEKILNEQLIEEKNSRKNKDKICVAWPYFSIQWEPVHTPKSVRGKTNIALDLKLKRTYLLHICICAESDSYFDFIGTAAVKVFLQFPCKI